LLTANSRRLPNKVNDWPVLGKPVGTPVGAPECQ